MKRYLLLFSLMAGFSGGYGQSQFILTFTGVDSISQNIIPIDSLYVKNMDQQSDTVLYGPYPVFYMTANWPVGINEPDAGSSDALILRQNYPNPFRGTTTVDIFKPYKGTLNLELFNGAGAKLSEYQGEFEQGSHLFEVASATGSVLYLVVSDERNLRMLKIVSIGQHNEGNTIRYVGPGNGIVKSTAMAPKSGGFIFYLGDELMYTAYTNGYLDKTLFDSPTGNANYVFEMVSEYMDGVPTLTTAAVTNITLTTATSGGNVTSDGGSPVLARGVCWSTSPNPTILNEHTVDGGPGTGVFVSYLSGLTPGTQYYVRAYANNGVGTGYGDQKIFSTLPGVLPTVYTNMTNGITQTSALSGGNVTASGSYFVSARGVCWSTSPNATTADNHTLDGYGTGLFTSYLTGLAPATQYYVRAYATNLLGTSYGNELTFSTLQLAAPSVFTYEAMPVSASTAIGGGAVLSEGGTPVTARGVCWNTAPNPTTANNLTNDGNGTGSFVSNLTGLSPNTTYYVRAYATNIIGTSYGAEVMFNNTYWIGESYGGGLIFYLDNTWQHGLITTPNDLSVGAPWGCPGVFIGATSSAIGSGQDNTTAIVNGCSTPGIAARICDALVLNGYSDWFLPSADELSELVSQGAYIGGIVISEPYWSSTEIDQAGAIAMFWGELEWTGKATPGHVRAVRTF